ncbi:hypothetical protein VTL71DRAFT_1285 [Oculimacula yallundae]|uniref:Uncharacterized protein n=1 Tax=Oculimacula yallundae TaxID=86028 RepID=A0ABR4CBL5_9HELO
MPASTTTPRSTRDTHSNVKAAEENMKGKMNIRSLKASRTTAQRCSGGYTLQDQVTNTLDRLDSDGLVRTVQIQGVSSN